MAENTEAQAPPPQIRRYGDLDDDDEDDYMSEDEARQNGGADNEDDEYLKEQRAADQAAAQALPANVKSFITSLRSALLSGNVGQLHNLYSTSFPRLTQEHYSQVEWPEVEVASILADGNDVFAIFYKELYYRHIYSRLTPNIDDRFTSYENYCAIFNYILNSEGPVPVELPVQWLWDLVDEFVWQFSSFAHWRSKPQGKTEDEIALLAENPQVWSCYSVLNVLYSLIQKSKIQDQLKASKVGQDVEEVAGEYGNKPLYKMLGIYSMISLVRVHSLLGDYTLALKMLDDVDMKKLPTRDVPAAHVSVHYYVGFSYLMLQRYNDAIYHLSKGYLFHAGPKRGNRFGSNAASSDAVAKQADRMLALLAVAHALSPTKWDDSREVREARDALRGSEKYNEQFEVMSRAGEASLPVFEEVFKYGAPKTISPNSPPYNDPSLLEAYPDTVQHTINLFMGEIKNLIQLPDLRTLLKLYTSISLDKLATLTNKDKDELVVQLMLLKGNMKIVKWTETAASAGAAGSAGAEEGDATPAGGASSGGLLNGEELVVGNLGFSIDNDTISITETRRTRQFAGRFLSQGLATKQILDQLKGRPLPAPVLSGQSSAPSHPQSAASQNQSSSEQRPSTKTAFAASSHHNREAAGSKSVAWAGKA